MSPAPSIRHILVPHDFGRAADAALAYALGLAEKFGARITVLHAYDLPAYAYPDAFIASFEFSSELERLAAGNLQKVAAGAKPASVRVDTLLRQGSAWAEIVHAANSLDVDLIVMGTHGSKGIHHLLLGSVAEKVVRAARCPVLTMRAAS